MTERSRETGAELDPEGATFVRTGREVGGDEEPVGYARADLRDALARIRDTMGPRALDDLGRGRSIDRTADGSMWLEEVRALGAKVYRLNALLEAASDSTRSLAAASTRNEERLASLSSRIDDAQAAQDRASSRLWGLSIAGVVLGVVACALLIVDIGLASGG